MPVGQGDPLARSPACGRGKRASSSSSTGEPSQKQQRNRGPNWSMHEMLALVNAKRDEFLEELDAVDGRDLMHSEVTKWTRISGKVMAAGFSSHFGMAQLARANGIQCCQIIGKLPIIMRGLELIQRTIGC